MKKGRLYSGLLISITNCLYDLIWMLMSSSYYYHAWHTVNNIHARSQMTTKCAGNDNVRFLCQIWLSILVMLHYILPKCIFGLTFCLVQLQQNLIIEQFIMIKIRISHHFISMTTLHMQIFLTFWAFWRFVFYEFSLRNVY